jgi:hypothetical protein
MNRRILLIILSAIALALVVGLIWFFFFRGGPPIPTEGGSFGTGQNRPTTGTGTTGTQGNVPSTVVNTGTSGTGGTTGANTGTGGGGSGGSGTSGGVVTNPGGLSSVPGIDWLGGTNPDGGGGSVTTFVPSTINQLNDGGVSGNPGLLGTNLSGQGGNNSTNLGLFGLFGAGAGCLAYAAFQGSGEAQASAELGAGIAGGAVLVIDWRANAKQATTKYKDIGDCLTRTIGRAIVQQITNSIVNWINSGFNGKPSFVTNYEQFFSNVGDQAAGEFIRGTGLAFLCSPFQAQIRIAIAQSYARRNAQSCTLTGIVRNLNSFMNGNFAQGGWAGLLQFTSIPTNNPFGAYAYAQMGLANARQTALNNASRNLSPGGFISLQKDQCDTLGIRPDGSPNTVCRKVVTTPGTVIEAALKKTVVDVPYDALNLAKSFDEIINALITQLTTRTLYQGLSTLSGTQGYASDYLTPAEQQAQANAQNLLTDMQGRLRIVQQYGTAWQGAIADIQNTQLRLTDLANCYSTSGREPIASSTIAIRDAYEPQVNRYNDNITRTNQAIALLQDLQTQVISVVTPADVVTVQNRYQQALSGGTIPSQAEVTNAQQDRASLQSALQIRNQQTASELQQCNAF